MKTSRLSTTSCQKPTSPGRESEGEQYACRIESAPKGLLLSASVSTSLSGEGGVIKLWRYEGMVMPPAVSRGEGSWGGARQMRCARRVEGLKAAHTVECSKVDEGTAPTISPKPPITSFLKHLQYTMKDYYICLACQSKIT